jgi:hypothetical protein
MHAAHVPACNASASGMQFFDYLHNDRDLAHGEELQALRLARNGHTLRSVASLPALRAHLALDKALVHFDAAVDDVRE